MTDQTTERLGWRIAPILVSVISVTFWRETLLKGLSMVCVYVLDTSQNPSSVLSIYRFRETDSDLIYLLMDALTSVSRSYPSLPSLKKNSHPVNSKIGSSF